MTGLLHPDGSPRVLEGAIPADATPENCPLTPSVGTVVIVREAPAAAQKRVMVPGNVKKGMRAMMAEARVMAVGGPTWFNCGEPWPAPCKVGDRVLTSGVSGFSTHKQEGSDTIWELLPFQAIVAIVSEDSRPEIPEHRGISGGMG